MTKKIFTTWLLMCAIQKNVKSLNKRLTNGLNKLRHKSKLNVRLEIKLWKREKAARKKAQENPGTDEEEPGEENPHIDDEEIHMGEGLCSLT
jgi:hypothetical protein